MRLRPRARRALLVVAACSFVFGAVLALVACAGVLGLDDVTVADDGGGTDASARLDASVRDSGVSSGDGGHDASQEVVDAQLDASADADADMDAMCVESFRTYTATELLNTACIGVVQAGGSVSSSPLPDGGVGLLISVSGDGTTTGAAGLVFDVVVPTRGSGGTVFSCNVYGNLVGATIPVPLTLIGQVTPLSPDGDAGGSVGSVYMHDDVVGIDPSDDSVLDGGLDNGTINFELAVDEFADSGPFAYSYTIFTLDNVPNHLTPIGGAATRMRFFFGVETTGAVTMFLSHMICSF